MSLKMPSDWKLCGSRWYGDSDENSDYDYIHESTDEAMQWLKANGFEEAFYYEPTGEEKGK